MNLKKYNCKSLEFLNKKNSNGDALKFVPLFVCISCVFIFTCTSPLFKLVIFKVHNSSKWFCRLNRFKFGLSFQLRSEFIHCGALILLCVYFILSPFIIKLNTEFHHLFYPLFLWGIIPTKHCFFVFRGWLHSPINTIFCQ